jgi:hypothetical protein
MRLERVADVFESAWLKWAWGVVDANVLADNVNTFASQPEFQMPILMRQDYDARRHCIVVTVADVAKPLFPPLWGLLLGAAVYNFRCALDHVAWTLYKRGRTPNLSPGRERQVYFPISDSRAKFNASLKTKLPGVRRADIAKVRRCQPYIKGKRNLDRHVLWVLDELGRLDRHRTIQPVVPVPDRSAYDIGEQTDCIYRRTSVRNPRSILEPGAELTRLYVKRTGPEPYIDVQPHFTIDPAVKARLTLQEFLTRTMRAISLILYEFAEPPPSVKAITGSTPRRP